MGTARDNEALPRQFAISSEQRGIRPVANEWFRYLVLSESEPNIWHLVDLEAYHGNGACDCKDFLCHHEPKLRDGKRDVRYQGIYRCKHIERAGRYFQHFMIRETRRHLNRPVHPTNRKRYILK